MAIDWDAAREEAVEVLRDLLRLDTTNPPGGETAAARYLEARFSREGIAATVVEPAPGRGSVVARLPSSGRARPLLLSAHLDVVPADPAEWRHPPFGGVVAGGCVWGRGAVDMKYVAAQAFVVLATLRRQRVPLERDVIFAGVADEEQGGRLGAGFLVDQHRALIDAEFCMTELGGMALPLGSRRVVLVQVAEKGFEWVRVRARGTPGHGSKPSRDNAVHKLSAGLARLGRARLEHHVCAPAGAFLDGLAAAQGGATALAARLLRHPRTAPLALRLIPDPDKRQVLEAVLYNTAVPTSLAAGSAGSPNVVWRDATAVLDGRYLPGVTRERFLGQLREVLGPELELESIEGLPPVEFPVHTPLMTSIERVVARRLPGALVTPYVIPGFTDAKHYARAGITTYGFAPVVLGKDEPFAALYHSPDERISIAGFTEGTAWLYDVVVDLAAGLERRSPSDSAA